MQLGWSNVVDPVGCTKPGLLDHSFGSILRFPQARTKQHREFTKFSAEIQTPNVAKLHVPLQPKSLQNAMEIHWNSRENLHM